MSKAENHILHIIFSKGLTGINSIGTKSHYLYVAGESGVCRPFYVYFFSALCKNLGGFLFNIDIYGRVRETQQMNKFLNKFLS